MEAGQSSEISPELFRASANLGITNCATAKNIATPITRKPVALRLNELLCMLLSPIYLSLKNARIFIKKILNMSKCFAFMQVLVLEQTHQWTLI
jgi:hypothetical protein